MSGSAGADWPEPTWGGTTEAFAEVLSKVRAGDQQAFADLYRALQPRLLRYLGMRSVDPDDVAADTWLAVVRDLDSFAGDENAFRAWVFAIARNRAADAGRAAGRRPAVPVGDDLELLDQVEGDAAEPVISAMSTRSALELVASLPPDQSEAVALRVLAELDVAEVAEIMGRSPGAVRVLTHRGLRTLAARLGDRTAAEEASAPSLGEV
ncbi:MAG TPA: RNA polymerase sigma factor [Solirubrobacterales bacterium]